MSNRRDLSGLFADPPPAVVHAPEVVIPALPAAPDIPEVVDETREQRFDRITEILGNGGTARDVLRTLTKEFPITPDQAQADLADVQDIIMRQHDSAASIEAVFYQIKARRHLRSRHFHKLALEPIPTEVFEAPGPDPDDPSVGAFYRPLTPGERASHMQARKNAADVAHREDEALADLYSRRSKRWAKAPSTAVQVNVNNASPETIEILGRLGMGQ